MPLSRLVASRDTTHGVLRSREWVPWVGTVRTVSWQMHPSLVLKSRNMKCCPYQPEMSSLPNMTYKSRLCSEKVTNPNTHMI